MTLGAQRYARGGEIGCPLGRGKKKFRGKGQGADPEAETGDGKKERAPKSSAAPRLSLNSYLSRRKRDSIEEGGSD